MAESSSGLVSSGGRARGGVVGCPAAPTRVTGTTGTLAGISDVRAPMVKRLGGIRIATTLRAVSSASRSALSPGDDILSAVRMRGDSRWREGVGTEALSGPAGPCSAGALLAMLSGRRQMRFQRAMGVDLAIFALERGAQLLVTHARACVEREQTRMLGDVAQLAACESAAACNLLK